jgi:para-aminobenzoate synthetase component II
MVKKVLIFDNYDSFTQNLYNLLKSTRPNYNYYVLRNKDNIIFDIAFDVLIISPGPMRPSNTGILKQLFEEKIIPNKIPVLGVCLGMQFIAEYYGAKIIKSKNAMHGNAVDIEHNGTDIFSNIGTTIKGARYNSLEVESVDNCKNIEAIAFEKENKSIMALKHEIFPFSGVQFHPESFLTERGKTIIDNFFKMYVEI